MKVSRWEALLPASLAFVLAAVAYWHNNILLDWADEGFLWYGAIQTFHGAVPIRDFQSYDPGRYYWCAAVFSLFGKGILSLRLAAGLFQWVGLCFGLCVLRRVVKKPLFLLIAGLTALFWMLLPFRYFDASLPMMTLFFAVRLAEKPSKGRHFAAGVATGLVIFFGLNHGLYALAAFSWLLLFLNRREGIWAVFKKAFSFALGLLAGLLPLGVMFVWVPGFWTGYAERFAELFVSLRQGTTNDPYGILWPWMVSWREIGQMIPKFSSRLLEFASLFSQGLFFLLMVVFYPVAFFSAWRMKRVYEPPRALFVASLFIGVFYLHHIFSRPDNFHTGEGIFPLWAGVLALPVVLNSKVKKTLASGLVVIFAVGSFLAAGLFNNIIFKHMVLKEAMVWYPVGKDRLWLVGDSTGLVDRVRGTLSRFVPPDEPVLMAPFLTTFYCLLERTSPVYEIYFLRPSRSMEERDIREMEQKKVRWALLGDFWIDGRRENSLEYSHPSLWAYLAKHFEPVPGSETSHGYSLMKRKD